MFHSSDFIFYFFLEELKMLKRILFLATLFLSLSFLYSQEAAETENAATEQAAPAEQAAGPRRGGRAADGRARRNPQQMRENFISRLREDANELVKRYDADGDGVLNEAEKAAMEKDMKLVEELFQLSNSYRRILLIDKDGDFVITDEEAASADLNALRQAGGRRDSVRQRQTPAENQEAEGAATNRRAGGRRGGADANRGNRETTRRRRR